MAASEKNTGVFTGKDFGAISVDDLDKLYSAQRRAVKNIISGIHEIASRAAEEHVGVGPDDRSVALRKRKRDYERPHHSYVVDGVRGSGKTTALLTIRNFIENLHLDSGIVSGVVSNDLRSSLGKLQLKPPEGCPGQDRAALVLPVVFTEDLEARETSMDAIFALIQNELDHLIHHHDHDNTKKVQLENLKKELKEKITFPWAFARGIGSEALLQDTVDYRDYVARRAEYNQKSYTRIDLWHEFIERLLEALGRKVLVILFDDSDLDQRASEDIIRSMRIYLSHPRITSVLAVDMRTLSTATIAHNLSRDKNAIELAEVGLANEMVGRTILNTRALLDKILPIALRLRLNIDDLSYLNSFFNLTEKDPYKSENDPFSSWCRWRFEQIRASEAKDFTEGWPDVEQSKGIWWLLNGPYRRLIADNVRHAVHFREQTRDFRNLPLLGMIEYSELQNLMYRIDGDLRTLRSQIEVGTMQADWPSGDEKSESQLATYEENFIDLLVDGSIFNRLLNVTNSAIVRGWLPNPIDLDDELIVDDTGKTFGVAGLGQTRLPRNCLYVYQYRRFSWLALRQLASGSHWLNYLGDLVASDWQAAASTFVEEYEDEPDSQVIAQIESFLDQVRGAGRSDPRVEWLRHLSATSFIAIFAAARSRDRSSFFQVLRSVEAGHLADEVETFGEMLTNAVRRAEQRRQQALFTWACALEIADMGDDNRRRQVVGPRRQLAVTFGATSREIEPRFRILVGKTLEMMAAGGRHALLLQWSLAPLLECLHRYGTDYQRAAGPSPAWKGLSQMRIATIPSENVDDPDTRWMFADMDQDILSGIVNDVKKMIRSLKTDLTWTTAPGSVKIGNSWPTSPERFLAAILITSEKWIVEEKLVPKTV